MRTNGDLVDFCNAFLWAFTLLAQCERPLDAIKLTYDTYRSEARLA